MVTVHYAPRHDVPFCGQAGNLMETTRDVCAVTCRKCLRTSFVVHVRRVTCK